MQDLYEEKNPQKILLAFMLQYSLWLSYIEFFFCYLLISDILFSKLQDGWCTFSMVCIFHL